jgi:hypothetical protein
MILMGSDKPTPRSAEVLASLDSALVLD